MFKEEQKKEEIEIFKKFAQSCPYPIDINSIKSKLEPEPDIYCELSDRKSIAFELTECTSELWLELKNYLKTLEEKFYEEFKRLKSLKERFEGKTISIGYGSRIINNNQKDLVTDIISLISNKNNINENEIKISSQLVKKGIIEISKKDSPEFKISLHFAAGIWELSICIKILNKKSNKKYKTNADSIELLIYFRSLMDLQEEDFDDPGLKNCLKNLIENAKFKKVWFYSIKNDKILFVYPELK